MLNPKRNRLNARRRKAKRHALKVASQANGSALDDRMNESYAVSVVGNGFEERMNESNPVPADLSNQILINTNLSMRRVQNALFNWAQVFILEKCVLPSSLLWCKAAAITSQSS